MMTTKRPWYEMTGAELLAEARRSIQLARGMQTEIAIARACGNAYAETAYRQTLEMHVHNAGFFRHEWQLARRIGVERDRSARRGTA
jgi:hypothetical protein